MFRMTISRKPAPKVAPSVSIRFRSKAELEQIRRAASIEGMSLNTFVAFSAALKSREILTHPQSEETAQAI
jgi:uncharacterized protein (DUF1778 family)